MPSHFKNSFKTINKVYRSYFNHQILLRKIYQIETGDFVDPVSDELIVILFLNLVLLKLVCHISRFSSWLDEITLSQPHKMSCDLHKRMYSIA